MLYIGNAWKGKTPRTWHHWNIKIPKPPCIRSLKINGLLCFWKFLGLSEENYNLQSLWITLYVLEVIINYWNLCPLYIMFRLTRPCHKLSSQMLPFVSLEFSHEYRIVSMFHVQSFILRPAVALTSQSSRRNVSVRFWRNPKLGWL